MGWELHVARLDLLDCVVRLFVQLDWDSTVQQRPLILAYSTIKYMYIH